MTTENLPDGSPPRRAVDRRGFIQLGGGLAAASLLAGCGGGGGGSAGGGPKTLQVVFFSPLTFADTKPTDALTKAEIEMTNKVLAMFKRQDGYTVDRLNWGWADPLQQKILLSIAGGTAPDVIAGEDFIKSLARSNALEAIPLGSLASQLAKGPLSEGAYKGTTYATAFATGTLGLIYNKKLMRQAGLDPSKPPKTWDDWVAQSEKIAGLGSDISGTIVEANTGLGAMFRVYPHVRQAGGDLANADQTKATFDTPEVVTALTFLRKLAATSTRGVTAMTDETKFFQQWLTNKAGFVVDGPWQIASSQVAKLDFGVAPLPVPSSGKLGNVIIGNALFAVPKATKHKKQAIDWCTMIASEPVQRLMVQTTGRLSGNLKVMADLKKAGKTTPEFEIFVDALKTPNLTALPDWVTNSSKIYEAFYSAQLAVMATTKPIPDIVKEAQATADALTG